MIALLWGHKRDFLSGGGMQSRAGTSPPLKKNFPGMVCRVGSDSSRFLGILRDAEEEVDEETIKAGKIPPQKGALGTNGKCRDEQRELGEIPLDLGGSGSLGFLSSRDHGGEGTARWRLQPRMPSARKKPSALGNSGMASALPPEIREQRSAPRNWGAAQAPPP